MKHLFFTDRKPRETEPNQDIEWAVTEMCRNKGLEMPSVRAGWKRDGVFSVEMSQEQFPGAKPIWYWEVPQ